MSSSRAASLQVRAESLDALADHETVSIAFTARTRLCVTTLRASHGRTLLGVPMTPRLKDYDAYHDERPTALPARFDVARWGLLSAFLGEARVGGALVARATPGYELLEDRDDLALLVDLRVQPARRGCGVGRALFRAVMDWAANHRCAELRVETQDTNVAACRFYVAMGCTLAAIDEGAYGETSDEVRLLWRIAL